MDYTCNTARENFERLLVPFYRNGQLSRKGLEQFEASERQKDILNITNKFDKTMIFSPKLALNKERKYHPNDFSWFTTLLYDSEIRDLINGDIKLIIEGTKVRIVPVGCFL